MATISDVLKRIKASDRITKGVIIDDVLISDIEGLLVEYERLSYLLALKEIIEKT